MCALGVGGGRGRWKNKWAYFAMTHKSYNEVLWLQLVFLFFRICETTVYTVVPCIFERWTVMITTTLSLSLCLSQNVWNYCLCCCSCYFLKMQCSGYRQKTQWEQQSPPLNTESVAVMDWLWLHQHRLVLNMFRLLFEKVYRSVSWRSMKSKYFDYFTEVVFFPINQKHWWLYASSSFDGVGCI